MPSWTRANNGDLATARTYPYVVGRGDDVIRYRLSAAAAAARTPGKRTPISIALFESRGTRRLFNLSRVTHAVVCAGSASLSAMPIYRGDPVSAKPQRFSTPSRSSECSLATRAWKYGRLATTKSSHRGRAGERPVANRQNQRDDAPVTAIDRLRRPASVGKSVFLLNQPKSASICSLVTGNGLLRAWRCFLRAVISLNSLPRAETFTVVRDDWCMNSFPPPPPERFIKRPCYSIP